VDQAGLTHIVVISTSYPDKGDGEEAAGSFVADVVQELATRVKVTVVAPGDSDRTEQQGMLTVVRFRAPRRPLSLLKISNPAHWKSILATLRAGARAVDLVTRSGGVDHLLALWALPSGYWARSMWRKRGIPYSVWALGSDIWGVGTFPVVKSVLRRVLIDARWRFADGYLLKKSVEAICGRECTFLPSARRLPCGISKSLASESPYSLAYLGRWHPNKGVDLLLGALELLADDDWARISEVRIYGGGPLEPLVSKGCDRLVGAGRPVSRGGYLNKNGAADLLRWADYLIIPSRIESIPVVFSDAMQARCPVVCTPVGDLPRLLRQYRVGVCAHDVSSRALAAGIRVLLHKSPNEFAASLESASKDFRVDAVVERIVALLARA